MAAEQVLHVVLGGHAKDIDAGLIHQPVEPVGVEGMLAWAGKGLVISSMIEAPAGHQ